MLNAGRLLLVSAFLSSILSSGCGEPAGATDGKLRAAIERDVEFRFNSLPVPVGEITVMTPRESANVPADPKNRVFPWKFLSEYLKTLEAGGHLTLRVHESEGGWLDMMNLGRRRVSVTPSEQLMALRDEAFSTDEMLQLVAGRCEIEKIISNTPYQSESLPEAGQYRLVLGTYKVVPVEDFIELEGADMEKVSRHKFRSVVEVNPFTDGYSVKATDWGDPDEDGWKTSNVP